MNQDNPYQVLRAAFGDAKHTDGPCTGRLLSVAPVAVQAGGLTLSGDELRINPDLLTRQATAIGPDSQTYAVTIPSTLSVGDELVLLPMGPEPIYYVICKAVIP